MAIHRPDAFMKGPRTGKTPVRGNISPPCIQIQLILARYACHIQKAPQSAVGECTARASCRQGAFSPSEALKSCTARKSCHPLMALPLRRTGPEFQNREQVGAEAPAEAVGPAGPTSALPKRPSKGRVPLDRTIGAPPPKKNEADRAAAPTRSFAAIR